MTEEQKKSKKEIAQKVTEQIKQADAIAELEGMIKRNVVEWEFNEIKYRVRKPTNKENQEIRRARSKKYLELLKDDAYVFKDQLIEQLEKKGKSINKLDNKALQIQAQINNLKKELAKYGDQDEKNAPIITDLKLKIDEMKQEINYIGIIKRDLLSGTIEDTLLEFEASYCAYLLSEKLEGDKWVKVFKTYEEFDNSLDDQLLGIIASHLGLLLFGINRE